jgi:hypothetical protein
MASTAATTAKPESDYSQWSSERLVQRVLLLETALKRKLDG